jgi:hypothetical protein
VKLRRYLLGELTLEEQVLLEQRLFLDTEYTQVAQAVEDDLIDDYVHGVLTEVEREKFKTSFLKRPEHREDLRIAQALDRYFAAESRVDPVTPLRPLSYRKTVLWVALAATVLIVLSVITWNVFRSVRRTNEDLLQAGGPQPAPTESATPPQQVVPSQKPNQKPSPEREKQQPQRPSPGVFATYTIYPGAGTRGSGQTNEVTISSTAKNVLLKMPLVTVRDYDKYRLELRDGGRVLLVRNLKVSIDQELGRIVSLRIPVQLFKQRNYEMRLRGINIDGSFGEPTTFAFTVKKQ